VTLINFAERPNSSISSSFGINLFSQLDPHSDFIGWGHTSWLLLLKPKNPSYATGGVLASLYYASVVDPWILCWPGDSSLSFPCLFPVVKQSLQIQLNYGSWEYRKLPCRCQILCIHLESKITSACYNFSNIVQYNILQKSISFAVIALLRCSHPIVFNYGKNCCLPVRMQWQF